MKASVTRCIAIGAIAVVMMSSEAVRADCYSEQQRIVNHLQRVMNEMNSANTGFCSIARSIKRDYQQILDFYDRCPIVDPDGSMRTHVQEMLQWADQVERTACD